MSELVRIVIGGDICPTSADLELFENGRADALLPREFLDLFASSQFSMVNVECPLTMATVPISKIGPALKAPPGCINFYRALNVSSVCLANNHILDYGDQGVADTLTAFAKAGISTVGAGTELQAARKPLLKYFDNGRRLAVVAMAESEFCIAGNASAGANPIDFANYTLIRNLKCQADKVLVVLHAGTELRTIPRPGLVELCHFLVDQGADAVIVQHTHCIGGVERYRSGLIVYGQGNFIFGNLNPGEVLPPKWWEGMLVELFWDRSGGELGLELHPFIQRSDGVGLRLLTDAETQSFQAQQQEFSELIRDTVAVEVSWQEFCDSAKNRVLLSLMGATRMPRALAYRGLPLVRIWSWLTDHLLLQNFISCESHRELALGVLRRLTKKL